MRLQGRVAVVTGGGRGIGRGIVQRFLDEGACVAVLQRNPVEQRLAEHARVAGVTADLSDPTAGFVIACLETAGLISSHG